MKDKVLVVEDDEDQCEALASALRLVGFEVRATTSPNEALEALVAENFDVVLTDLGMEEMDGLALCERVPGINPDAVIIVVTGRTDIESAIRAMQVGAFDFLTKPVDLKLLTIAVSRAAKHHQLKAEVKRLRDRTDLPPPSEGIVGTSTAMKRVYALVDRVSGSDASVLLQGETGTGKEVVARAIHAMSPRRAKPFVAINCAAVPATLLESELFGHARGAFTDAKAAHQGLFAQATGGTLFLDEIGDMPAEMQPKLLRALQERKVRPVGDTNEVPFDVRLICASNRDLESEVYEKRFREDLYYRINVVTIALPPLRERAGDVLALAAHFLEKFGKKSQKPGLSLSLAAAQRLSAYDWPGNVREVENCIEHAVAMTRFDQVVIEDLPEKIRGYRPQHFIIHADDSTQIVSLAELERRYILRVLKLVAGNKSRAAHLLGLDRRTLYRKLERYAVEGKSVDSMPPGSMPPGSMSSSSMSSSSMSSSSMSSSSMSSSSMPPTGMKAHESENELPS